MYLAKQMGIAAAVETTYGADIVPTAALNAILAENIKLIPLDGDEIVDEHARPGGMGAFLKEMINKRCQLAFDVKLRGSGTADGIPAIDPILRAVGFAGVTNATVSRAYKLASQSLESATIYLFRGNSANGIRHRMLGVRGSWKFSIDPKKNLMISFSLIGLYTDPTSLAMPTNFSFTGFTSVPLVPVNKANTTFALGGYAAILAKLDIDSGVTATHQSLVNYEAVDITARNITGTAVVQEPAIATKDYFSSAYGSPEAMVFENGLTAGQIFRIDAARVQRGKPDPTDIDGTAALSLPLVFAPSDAGDDNDIVLTFK